MSIKQQGVSAPLSTSPRDFPDPPTFPDSMSTTSLQKYRLAQGDWWRAMKANLQAMNNEIEDLKGRPSSS